MVVEHNAPLGETVDVGRLDPGISVGMEVMPVQGVHQDKDRFHLSCAKLIWILKNGPQTVPLSTRT